MAGEKKSPRNWGVFQTMAFSKLGNGTLMSLNPLEIGECFRLLRYTGYYTMICLNPLEIGECFRHNETIVVDSWWLVLIP